ncbi:MAG: hypothetical protein KA821_07450 [Chitinophagaceae bacterium]|nr:hypothetical protein [Chitinophagaceae bacterium]
MERNFSNRDFERYVQEYADQYRMFPSEKVWKGIHSSLHKRRRWYGFGLAFLLLMTGGAVTLVMRSYPTSKKQNIASAPSFTQINASPESSEALADNIKEKEADGLKNLLRFDQSAVNAQHSDGNTTSAASSTLRAPFLNSFEENSIQTTAVIDPAAITDNEPPVRLSAPQLAVAGRKSEQNITNSERTLSPTGESPVIRQEEDPASRQSDFHLTSAAIKNTTLQSNVPLLFSAENITNSYKPRPARVQWQLFLTPTVSYRRLTQNKSFNGTPSPGLPYPFAQLKDVNKAVTHKPDLGFQLGVMARYPLARNLNLRAGLQFNVNRYDIKAFAYPAEVAVISLDDPASTTVATWTRYRSQNGYRSDWLKNYYFSVSVPIGAELTLFGNKKKTSVGIAGTVQPTYVLSDRAYLISTDYKNYAKVPWLIRHVNVSTGFEAFVNYGKGHTRWQIGPQVRYQLLSSFQNKYPVKENLFDFGLKIGMSINP